MQTVDVIIPVYKPDEKLEKLLCMLLKQSYPIEQIILIDSDETSFGKFFAGKESLLENKCIKVCHIDGKEFDHGRTRDYAIQMTHSEFVVCMTQDAVPKNDLLIENLLIPFADKKVAVSYARQLPNAECSYMERYARFFNYPGKSMVKSKEDLKRLGIKTYFCSNACAMYRRSTYDELGGFIKKTIFNEDMIYAATAVNAGYKIAYIARAKVIHSHNYTGKQQFHRYFDLAVSQADHPDIFAGIKSESEGVKLVFGCMSYLIKRKQFLQIFSLIYQNACKYIGYRIGKKYDKLSRKTILKFTMNEKYWL